jgi:spore germination protein YaaH
MEYAMELGDTYGAKWESRIRQYYAQWDKYPYVYKLWIEDTKSVSYKVQLVHMYNLAGAAFWRKGYEKTEIWPVIRQILDNPGQNLDDVSR